MYVCMHVCMYVCVFVCSKCTDIVCTFYIHVHVCIIFYRNQQAIEQKQASLSSRIKRQLTYSASDSRQSITVSPMSPLITSTTLITTQSDNDTALSKDEIIDFVFDSQVNIPRK